jgi:hypothetical protein
MQSKCSYARNKNTKIGKLFTARPKTNLRSQKTKLNLEEAAYVTDVAHTKLKLTLALTEEGSRPYSGHDLMSLQTRMTTQTKMVFMLLLPTPEW